MTRFMRTLKIKKTITVRGIDLCRIINNVVSR